VAAVDAALKDGRRGLNPGSSLAKLLLARRRRRHKGNLPPLTTAAILAWADAHHARTGSWPVTKSGPVIEAPAENWMALNAALRVGVRGLPGGDSLPHLLKRHRGAGTAHATSSVG
jgi:hypothetical protein